MIEVALSLLGSVLKEYLRAGPGTIPVETPIVASTRFIETARTEEPVGTEVRRINNSGSASSSGRRIRASRTWIRKHEFHFDKTTKKSFSGGVAIISLVNFRGDVEDAISRSEIASAQEESTFEEEIELTVPARTDVEVYLHWKRIWQEGLLIATTSAGETYEVPYRAVVGVTFDQESRDRDTV